MGTRKKWEKSVTLNLKKVTKSNKMEAVIRIFRITAGGSNFSYSERKTVIVIQTLYVSSQRAHLSGDCGALVV